MADFSFHLGGFNDYWENKTELTENQKIRKFAAWLIKEFEDQISRSAPKKQSKSNSAKAPQANRNVNNAWGAEQQYQPATDIDCGGLI